MTRTSAPGSPAHRLPQCAASLWLSGAQFARVITARVMTPALL
jgi:hypothetical protein